MRCVTYIVLVLFMAAGCAFADASKQIRYTLDQQVAAWNRGDLPGYMRGYWNSPELSFFSGGTVSRGWQSTLERYQKRYQGEGRAMGKLDFSDLSIEMLGEQAAFVRGRWHLKMPDGKEPKGLFTLIMRYTPHGWKIIHDHTSAE